MAHPEKPSFQEALRTQLSKEADRKQYRDEEEVDVDDMKDSKGLAKVRGLRDLPRVLGAAPIAFNQSDANAAVKAVVAATVTGGALLVERVAEKVASAKDRAPRPIAKVSGSADPSKPTSDPTPDGDETAPLLPEGQRKR